MANHGHRRVRRLGLFYALLMGVAMGCTSERADQGALSAQAASQTAWQPLAVRALRSPWGNGDWDMASRLLGRRLLPGALTTRERYFVALREVYAADSLKGRPPCVVLESVFVDTSGLPGRYSRAQLYLRSDAPLAGDHPLVVAKATAVNASQWAELRRLTDRLVARGGQVEGPSQWGGKDAIVITMFDGMHWKTSTYLDMRLGAPFDSEFYELCALCYYVEDGLGVAFDSDLALALEDPKHP